MGRRNQQPGPEEQPQQQLYRVTGPDGQVRVTPTPPPPAEGYGGSSSSERLAVREATIRRGDELNVEIQTDEYGRPVQDTKSFMGDFDQARGTYPIAVRVDSLLPQALTGIDPRVVRASEQARDDWLSAFYLETNTEDIADVADRRARWNIVDHRNDTRQPSRGTEQDFLLPGVASHAGRDNLPVPATTSPTDLVMALLATTLVEKLGMPALQQSSRGASSASRDIAPYRPVMPPAASSQRSSQSQSSYPYQHNKSRKHKRRRGKIVAGALAAVTLLGVAETGEALLLHDGDFGDTFALNAIGVGGDSTKKSGKDSGLSAAELAKMKYDCASLGQVAVGTWHVVDSSYISTYIPQMTVGSKTYPAHFYPGNQKDKNTPDNYMDIDNDISLQVGTDADGAMKCAQDEKGTTNVKVDRPRTGWSIPVSEDKTMPSTYSAAFVTHYTAEQFAAYKKQYQQAVADGQAEGMITPAQIKQHERFVRQDPDGNPVNDTFAAGLTLAGALQAARDVYSAEAESLAQAADKALIAKIKKNADGKPITIELVGEYRPPVNDILTQFGFRQADTAIPDGFGARDDRDYLSVAINGKSKQPATVTKVAKQE